MRIGSLCSGYGGLDMAVEAHYGATPAWVCEYDEAPSRILAQRFPHAPNYGDVWHTDWHAVEPVEVLTAGYPCQPFSQAGNRKGTDDPRHLWPGVAHAVSVLRPRLVVLENVRGHLSLGFDAVLGDLARLGYDARWGLVRASDAGAPHARARLFIVAYPEGDPWRLEHRNGNAAREGRDPGEPRGAGHHAADPDGAVDRRETDARGVGRQGHALPRGGPASTDPLDGGGRGDRRDQERLDPRGDGARWGVYGPAIARWGRVMGRRAPDPLVTGEQGQPTLAPRFTEWLMGLPDGWVTGADVGLTRTAQLKALGNGVVPQQARLALTLLDHIGRAAA